MKLNEEKWKTMIYKTIDLSKKKRYNNKYDNYFWTLWRDYYFREINNSLLLKVLIYW